MVFELYYFISISVLKISLKFTFACSKVDLPPSAALVPPPVSESVAERRPQTPRHLPPPNALTSTQSVCLVETWHQLARLLHCKTLHGLCVMCHLWVCTLFNHTKPVLVFLSFSSHFLLFLFHFQSSNYYFMYK